MSIIADCLSQLDQKSPVKTGLFFKRETRGKRQEASYKMKSADEIVFFKNREFSLFLI